MPRRFVAERRRDPYYRAARRQGLRSRAAFKLAYLDDRFRLLAPGARVLDLGAAPGGWSMVARERVGPGGTVVAVDPRPVEPIEGVRLVRGRVGDPRLAGRLGAAKFDLVLSDMSPRISGAYATDHARSVGIVRDGLGLAAEVLRPGGAFVAKVFDGDLVPSLERALADAFVRVRRTKPPASREPSSELYLLAFGFRGGPSATRADVAPAASDI
ncbi:MAG TPA: RlmE family RNA methyltransferase [Thermoplasmata archaeon]|jgi:23S rRNA (uridine2552-2'-O)-methyltransferase|nr:RlmE family RNA methyltransferase [Thermoplasmata archaeon]